MCQDWAALLQSVTNNKGGGAPAPRCAATCQQCLLEVVRVAFVRIDDDELLCVHPFPGRKAYFGSSESAARRKEAAETRQNMCFRGLSRECSLEWLFGRHGALGHGCGYHIFAERTKEPPWEAKQHEWDRFPDFERTGMIAALARKRFDYAVCGGEFLLHAKMAGQFCFVSCRTDRGLASMRRSRRARGRDCQSWRTQKECLVRELSRACSGCWRTWTKQNETFTKRKKQECFIREVKTLHSTMQQDSYALLSLFINYSRKGVSP